MFHYHETIHILMLEHIEEIRDYKNDVSDRTPQPMWVMIL